MGTIRLIEKAYVFEQSTFNEKMFSPSSKYKRGQPKGSEDSRMNSKLLDAVNKGRGSSQIRKRPYFHQLIVANEPNSIRICNDLLGAGLDPLTYKSSHSKLIDSSAQLMAKEFLKPEPKENRHPCVIDKFSRTKGTQLTGLKVGNSIVVRIGSNYSPSARNYYLDITTKNIQHVDPEARIRLDHSKPRCVLPAD
jgi:hypothetical protein